MRGLFLKREVLKCEFVSLVWVWCWWVGEGLGNVGLGGGGEIFWVGDCGGGVVLFWVLKEMDYYV